MFCGSRCLGYSGMVRGGSNVRIYHQVTIGADRKGAAVISNNILIGAGAKIIGPLTSDDGAQIGANAVVVHDVPAGATVVGIPAHVVRGSGNHAEGQSIGDRK